MKTFARWTLVFLSTVIGAGAAWLAWNAWGFPQGSGDMEALRNDNAIGLAAVLSAVTAAAMGSWAGRERKPEAKLDLEARIDMPLRHSEDSDSHGTPVKVKQGRDVKDAQILITMKILNTGERPVQVLAVLIESRDGDTIHIRQIEPPPLPLVVDPYTSVQVSFQKEHIDIDSEITFFGVIDGLGVRYPLQAGEVISLVKQSWGLPTRVSWFRRRDDPTEVVKAYQTKEKCTLSTRELKTVKKLPKTLVSRDEPKPPGVSKLEIPFEPESPSGSVMRLRPPVPPTA
ncbi:hypothetical protein [Micromonospora haikouensis]|uniref:hypothetical protein n=1 Tax=Micromonospora haikouensis TaxID=686309 RepID=UPI003D73BA09